MRSLEASEEGARLQSSRATRAGGRLKGRGTLDAGACALETIARSIEECGPAIHACESPTYKCLPFLHSMGLFRTPRGHGTEPALRSQSFAPQFEQRKRSA